MRSLVSQSASVARQCMTKSTRVGQVRPFYTMSSVAVSLRPSSPSLLSSSFSFPSTSSLSSSFSPSSSLSSSFSPSSSGNLGAWARSGPVTAMLEPTIPPLGYFSSPVVSLPSNGLPKEIIFLGGAPGSGKGTNSDYISKLRGYSAPTIVVSDLLNTPACKLLKDNGIMVNDAFVFEALLTELQKPAYRKGVVVDGFPRTETQVEYLNQFHQNQTASSLFLAPPTRFLFVMLHVDETVSIFRQQERGRKIMTFNERKSAGKSKVELRQTDIDIEASKARYVLFKEQLEAMMSLGDHFPLVVVDAGAEPGAVKVNITTQMASFPPVL